MTRYTTLVSIAIFSIFIQTQAGVVVDKFPVKSEVVDKFPVNDKVNSSSKIVRAIRSLGSYKTDQNTKIDGINEQQENSETLETSTYSTALVLYSPRPSLHVTEDNEEGISTTERVRNIVSRTFRIALSKALVPRPTTVSTDSITSESVTTPNRSDDITEEPITTTERVRNIVSRTFQIGLRKDLVARPTTVSPPNSITSEINY